MMLPWRFLFGLALLVIWVVCLIGWGVFRSPPFEIFSDMVRQPRMNAQAPSDFFADGRSSRPPVQGTIPLGYSMPSYSSLPGDEKKLVDSDLDFGASNSYRDTGKFGTDWGTGIPLEVNTSLMKRGQERFSIHCAVCHGASGWGDGMATKYGLVGVANLHLMRIRSLPDGEIFDVITHGKNLMMPLGAQISVPDRWAIVAYIRALQRSQQTEWKDVPPLEKQKLETLP